MQWRRGLLDQRGASLTEYVLIGFLVLCAVGVAYKALGSKMAGHAVTDSRKTLMGENAEPSHGGGGVYSGDSSGKSTVAMKVTVSNGAAKAKELASNVGSKVSEEAAQIDLFDFSFKKMARWLAIAIAALGVGVGFSVYRRGRAEMITAEALDPDSTGPGSGLPGSVDPGSMGPTGVAPRGIASGTRAPTKWTD